MPVALHDSLEAMKARPESELVNLVRLGHALIDENCGEASHVLMHALPCPSENSCKSDSCRKRLASVACAFAFVMLER